MLFETTPDTSSYMIAGYTVAFVVMGLYVLSLFIRNRNLERDVEMLNGIIKAVPSSRTKKEAKKPVAKKKSGGKKK